MMHYSDDPIRDAELTQLDQERWLESLPVCDECGEHIQSEDLYELDGLLFCESCMEGHRRSTEDYRREEY